MKVILELCKKYEEIIVYLIVGVMTTVLNLVVYYVCVFTFLDPLDALELQVANIIAWTIGVIFAYVTNRKFVFKSKNSEIKKESLKFFGARIVTLVMDMLVMYLSVTVLRVNDKIMKLISNMVVIILNYVFSKNIVFKKNDKF